MQGIEDTIILGELTQRPQNLLNYIPPEIPFSQLSIDIINKLIDFITDEVKWLKNNYLALAEVNLSIQIQITPQTQIFLFDLKTTIQASTTYSPNKLRQTYRDQIYSIIERTSRQHLHVKEFNERMNPTNNIEGMIILNLYRVPGYDRPKYLFELVKCTHHFNLDLNSLIVINTSEIHVTDSRALYGYNLQRDHSRE